MCKLFFSFIVYYRVFFLLFMACQWNCPLPVIMRPSSLGGGRILRRTLSVRLSVRLSVCLSVRPSRYHYRASRRATKRITMTHVVFGTHRGPHIVRPSRPHKLVFKKKNLKKLTVAPSIGTCEVDMAPLRETSPQKHSGMARALKGSRSGARFTMNESPYMH